MKREITQHFGEVFGADAIDGLRGSEEILAK